MKINKYSFYLKYIISGVIFFLFLVMIWPKKIHGYSGNITEILQNVNHSSNLLNFKSRGKFYYTYISNFDRSEYIQAWGYMQLESIKVLSTNSSFHCTEIEDFQASIPINKGIPHHLSDSLTLSQQGSENPAANSYLTERGTIIYLEYSHNREIVKYVIVKESGFFYLQYSYRGFF